MIDSFFHTGFPLHRYIKAAILEITFGAKVRQDCHRLQFDVLTR